MTSLTPQLAFVAVLTTGIGAVMSRLGLLRTSLRLRHESRCANCSRLVSGPRCPDCGRAC
jgi:hypothetical protein